MTLNPNAAEFFPSALKPSRNVEPSGRVVNRSISLSLGASDDDDFTRYWRDHLPDDIIPDFGTVASTRDDRSRSIWSFKNNKAKFFFSIDYMPKL